MQLALTRIAKGAPEEAEESVRLALASCLELYGEDSHRTATARGVLGRCLFWLAREVEGEAELLAAQAVLARRLGGGHRTTLSVVRVLVSLYESTGQDELAATWRAALPEIESL